MPKLAAISLQEITPKLAGYLAQILSSDTELNKSLSRSNATKISAAQFLKQTKAWMAKTNSHTWAIVRLGKAIGTISISHINGDSRSARVGYWIASRFWGQGYGTLSVNLTIKAARKLGLVVLRATAKPDNLASIKIWEKLNATSRQTKSYIIFKLEV